MTDLSASLDRANPNTLADQFRTIALGQTLQQDVKQTLRVDADALGGQPEDAATADIIVPASPAGVILRAWARAATANAGEATVGARHGTIAAGEIRVTPAGNIGVLAADVMTDLIVEYLPERGDIVVTADLPVTANVLTLPAAISGNALVLMSAEALTATLTGRKLILTPGAAGPAAGQAEMDIGGTTVTFQATDAVTVARCTLLVDPAADLTALLADANQNFV